MKVCRSLILDVGSGDARCRTPLEPNNVETLGLVA